jgi:DNA polymerase III epsilon subunit-like protein
MNNNNYIVFDVETGGLDCMKNAITQIGAIVLSPDLKRIGTFESMVGKYGGLTYTDIALKKTNITMEMIEDAPSAPHVFKEFLEFLKLYIPKEKENYPIMVGQNVEFDMGFMTMFFDHFKDDFTKYCFNTYIDTLALSKLKFAQDKTVSQYKLTSLANKFHVELTDAHSALPDVEATAEIFIKMAFLLRAKDTPTGDLSIGKRGNGFQF